MVGALPGNWLPVLEWLHAYGRCPGLDIQEHMRKKG